MNVPMNPAGIPGRNHANDYLERAAMEMLGRGEMSGGGAQAMPQQAMAGQPTQPGGNVPQAEALQRAVVELAQRMARQEIDKLVSLALQNPRTAPHAQALIREWTAGQQGAAAQAAPGGQFVQSVQPVQPGAPHMPNMADMPPGAMAPGGSPSQGAPQAPAGGMPGAAVSGGVPMQGGPDGLQAIGGNGPAAPYAPQAVDMADPAGPGLYPAAGAQGTPPGPQEQRPAGWTERDEIAMWRAMSAGVPPEVFVDAWQADRRGPGAAGY